MYVGIGEEDAKQIQMYYLVAHLYYRMYVQYVISSITALKLLWHVLGIIANIVDKHNSWAAYIEVRQK